MFNTSLKAQRSYAQEDLLNDKSLNWKGVDRKSLLDRALKETHDSAIDRLRHTEVRYEVTDHCNAECVMCPVLPRAWSSPTHLPQQLASRRASPPGRRPRSQLTRFRGALMRRETARCPVAALQKRVRATVEKLRSEIVD